MHLGRENDWARCLARTFSSNDPCENLVSVRSGKFSNIQWIPHPVPKIHRRMRQYSTWKLACGHAWRISAENWYICPAKNSVNSWGRASKVKSVAKKDSQSQKFAWTAPKNVPNDPRGVPCHYPIKQGFWGKSHQKVHPNVRQNLCHTVSLWYLFCPQLR